MFIRFKYKSYKLNKEACSFGELYNQVTFFWQLVFFWSSRLYHPLSSLLDTHHGLANAVNIPYGMQFNIEGFEHKFKRIAQILKLPVETGKAVVQYLSDLNSKINIPLHLKDIGVRTEHIETLSDLAIADFAHPNNPKPVTREDFRRLYLKALG